MESKTLMVIGLIGGILAAVGVFLPWASSGGVDISGWDYATGATITVVGIPIEVPQMSSPYVVLAGGIIALIGALVALGAKSKGIGYLLPLGGLIALGGWAWAAADVADWSVVTYGFYACLVGAILALVGSLSLRGK